MRTKEVAQLISRSVRSVDQSISSISSIGRSVDQLDLKYSISKSESDVVMWNQPKTKGCEGKCSTDQNLDW